MKGNTEKLVEGDEVTLYHKNFGEPLGTYKVVGLSLDRTDRRYIAHKLSDSGTWYSGYEFGDDGYFTWEKISKTVAKTIHSNGCVCSKCNAGNPFAEPNLPDGKYICFECR